MSKDKTLLVLYSKIFIFSVNIFCLILFSGCTKNPVEPVGTSTSSKNIDSTIIQDTTTHNISWQRYNFGEPSPSDPADFRGFDNVFFTAEIIDENDIWLSGSVYIDSSDYNVFHWNGSDLERMQIYTTYNNQTLLRSMEIFAFGKNDILFWNSFEMKHWNGNTLEKINIASTDLENITSIWGISKNDFYALDRNGRITHFNGTVLEVLPSVTNLCLTCIYGAYNSITGKYDILAVGHDGDSNVLLQIDGSNAKILSLDKVEGHIQNIWFIPNEGYYIGGKNLYFKKRLTDDGWKLIRDDSNGENNVFKASAVNNLFVLNSNGYLYHFNGSTWSMTQVNYSGECGTFHDKCGDLRVKNNIVIVFGDCTAGKAVLKIGKLLK